VQLDEDYDEYFMVDLVPGVHYIPAILEYGVVWTTSQKLPELLYHAT
jgi:hypothetical protein